MTKQFLSEMGAESLRHHAIRMFVDLFGRHPDSVIIAPGRVNLIGEHVDYNEGWVLPAAIDRKMLLVVRKRPDRKIVIVDLGRDEKLEMEIGARTSAELKGWARYVTGVVCGMLQVDATIKGFDACLASNIPSGGGLSSSAALEAAIAMAIVEANGLNCEPLQLAKICQRAEQNFAGVPCGLMDQAAVFLGERDRFLLLDCATEKYCQIDFAAPRWTLMIINSRVAHELATAEYGERRSACHAAAEILGVRSLRHLTDDQFAGAMEADLLTLDMKKLVRHVFSENERTLQTVEAMKLGDYEKIGQLLNASHESLRSDYRVSCDELDFIAHTAQKLAGVAGCRMTGGGFGGSAVALVDTECTSRVAASIATAYWDRFRIEVEIFTTRPTRGITVWRL